MITNIKSLNSPSHNIRGSLWNRWDLHFHTPASFDYEDKSVTNRAIVDELLARNVRVIAVTDHHVIDVPRIRELQKLGGDKLTVLPGIELRSDQGGDPIHFICIFPEDCDLDHVWTTLQGSLGLTAAAIQKKGGDQKIYVPIERGADETRKLGGVVSIHAGGKSNSIEGISNKEQFQQRIKYDIAKQWVDLMEIGQLKDIDIHLNTIFPATGLDMPLVIDQPEGNLDNQTVAKILVDCIREARKRRQVFIVTHNPNLAVVCDADQVVYASMDKEDGNAITYVSGALENPVMTKHVTDVLEGTRWAFGVRGEKYKVGE